MSSSSQEPLGPKTVVPPRTSVRVSHKVQGDFLPVNGVHCVVKNYSKLREVHLSLRILA